MGHPDGEYRGVALEQGLAVPDSPVEDQARHASPDRVRQHQFPHEGVGQVAFGINDDDVAGAAMSIALWSIRLSPGRDFTVKAGPASGPCGASVVSATLLRWCATWNR